MDKKELRDRVRLQERAYRQLVTAADTLLRGRVFWTERALLSLVHRLYSRRLLQLTAVVTKVTSDESAPSPAVREAMLESMAEAALGGHELGSWEPVEGGYQAACRGCGLTTWLGDTGLRYSLLTDVCGVEQAAED